MRLIGYLDSEAQARLLGDYMYVRGIDNNVEAESPDKWGLWVKDEDQLDEAARLLTDFRRNPEDIKYRTESKGATALREGKQKEEKAWQKKLLSRRNLLTPLREYGFGPLTLALMIVSVVVYVLTKLLGQGSLFLALVISQYDVGLGYLPEVLQGQVWRLITPIFLHFGFLHIFFNVLWLRDLGSMIEARQSSLQLGLLVLVIGIGSNLAQYFLDRSPIFGGMSGVVYGLLGYVWIRGKFDPGSGLFLHQATVLMMMIWFAACFAGLVGNVANWAHAGGLALGMAWGYLSARKYR